MVDYSKWDNLEVSSDEEEDVGRMLGGGVPGVEVCFCVFTIIHFTSALFFVPVSSPPSFFFLLLFLFLLENKNEIHLKNDNEVKRCILPFQMSIRAQMPSLTPYVLQRRFPRSKPT